MAALHENSVQARGRRAPRRGRGERIRLLERDSASTASPAEAPPWEAACVARAARGDQHAFAKLVRHYTGRIYAHLYGIVRSREDAEDLTQEAFLRAFRALDRFDAGRPFANWLYTIATNVALNALRTRSRRLRPVSLDETDEHNGPLHEPASDLPDGRQTASRSERIERLEQAVAELPHRAAALVRLHYGEGVGLREAGEMLGMKENAAKVALHRARKQLRQLMTGEEAP